MATPGDHVVAFKSTDGNWFVIDLDSGAAAACSPFIASFPGTVVVDIESPPWYPPTSTTFSQLRLSLLAASAADLTVSVNVNGVSVETITLTAGNVTITAVVSVAVIAADAVTVTVTDVGTASNASIEMLCGAGTGGGDSFWAYDGSTLSPDPATTTPLDHFLVSADDGTSTASVEADTATGFTQVKSLHDADSDRYAFLYTEANPASDAQNVWSEAGGNAAIARAILSAGGTDSGVGLSAFESPGDGTSSLNLSSAGSFSLTADDGTYTIGLTGASSPGLTELRTTEDSDPFTVGALSLQAIDPGQATGYLSAGSSANDGSALGLNTTSGGGGSATLASTAAGFAPSLTVVATATTSAIKFGGVVAAPANGDLNASQFALWLDDTPGATFLNIKAKDSGGTVRTASVPLL